MVHLIPCLSCPLLLLGLWRSHLMNLKCEKWMPALISRSTLCTLAFWEDGAFPQILRKGKRDPPVKRHFPKQGPKAGASRKHRRSLELDCEWNRVLFNISGCLLPLTFPFSSSYFTHQVWCLLFSQESKHLEACAGFTQSPGTLMLAAAAWLLTLMRSPQGVHSGVNQCPADWCMVSGRWETGSEMLLGTEGSGGPEVWLEWGSSLKGLFASLLPHHIWFSSFKLVGGFNYFFRSFKLLGVLKLHFNKVFIIRIHSSHYHGFWSYC